ncbi:MAG TPA: 5-oxoprolinase subunit PxpB [Chitinophagaceae bacterium]|nr:5-oxoprolinase subunit PxpB [Chitinophagaceae bacterium]
MSSTASYQIFGLGDTALVVDFGNRIDEDLNRRVIQYCRHLKTAAIPGTLEIVPAYSSITLYYDPVAISKSVPAGSTIQAWVKEKLTTALEQEWETTATKERQIRIPVCYEEGFAPDLALLAAQRNLSSEEVIRIHSNHTYRVYMLGFLPGFTYMGKVDEAIAIPRKPQPVPVQPGSVGIAGRQTGVYPLASPGGWYIIGRTPIKLFDGTRENPVLLEPGDSVQFFSISKDEFTDY